MAYRPLQLYVHSLIKFPLNKVQSRKRNSLLKTSYKFLNIKSCLIKTFNCPFCLIINHNISQLTCAE